VDRPIKEAMKDAVKTAADHRASRVTKAEWDALLARIQSHSRELESELAKSNSNLIEALSGLEGLESLTDHHLVPLEPILPPAPAPSSVSAPAAQNPSAQPASVKYHTAREEYAPALNQNALVEALLQYQQKKAMRTPKPAAKPAAKASSVPAAPASRNDFTPMRIPAIEAEPKASPLGRSAAPSVRLPVLRLKSNPSSGNSSGNSNDDNI
jgi:hypothetical protein